MFPAQHSLLMVKLYVRTLQKVLWSPRLKMLLIQERYCSQYGMVNMVTWPVRVVVFQAPTLVTGSNCDCYARWSIAKLYQCHFNYHFKSLKFYIFRIYSQLSLSPASRVVHKPQEPPQQLDPNWGRSPASQCDFLNVRMHAMYHTMAYYGHIQHPCQIALLCVCVCVYAHLIAELQLMINFFGQVSERTGAGGQPQKPSAQRKNKVLAKECHNTSCRS